jgi:ATP-dependent DNA helicase RecG
LKGVGPRRAVPHRYEDATTVDPIAGLKPGDDATVIGRVVSKGVLQTRSRLRVFHAVIRDETGMIECAWPGRPWLERTIRKGDLLLVSGPVRFYHGRQLQPREHTMLARPDDSTDQGAADGGNGAGGGRVFPVYPATEGLTHRQIRTIVDANLEALLAELDEADPFPAAWLRELALPPLRTALSSLHQPRVMAEVEPARRRLAFEELFYLQLLHARARAKLRLETQGISFRAAPELTEPFLKALPFKLTGAQKRCWAEIREDMEKSTPMNRLLQGDVGSGKTVVAALAMLKAAEAGFQAALMAPTELLAEQHHRSLCELLDPIAMEPQLLTGSIVGKKRAEVLSSLAAGSGRLAVGTHALIQEAVEFQSLGLAVIDEQHRFGVEQRRLMREGGGGVDALVMSATPIPRSLALALYGDLDISVIDELPPGRRPIITGVRGESKREAAFEFLREQLSEGRQGYVVYPLIDESEVLEARGATAMRDELARRYPEFQVGLLHGRLAASEKESIMRGFLSGQIHLLVATTVIEVGIDVPNASVMLIEDADRFGLAQLHQLRGRVGRGADQSYCVAFYRGDSPPERLQVFSSTTDGFVLAEEDLRLRGQGDMFGREQHGVPALRFAELDRDRQLLEDARRRAREIVAEDPDLARPRNRRLGRELTELYGGREELYRVG